ncbi:hypothetical protein [Actinomycetospora straminea]|uniref:Uncharacterized protein n=1 Tax=Actinomycetospora straminea TaxID=663607 RepID=A0ABP9F4S4_9PSEU|nr:hypothetical protein [Actinomycetospora straminea]MDD7935797.1 hypothetical protein [Actinomycetospora straminea]
MSGLVDDGTRHNRLRRDGDDFDRGAGQTHGAGDPSAVDAEADPPPHDGAPAAPPSATTR